MENEVRNLQALDWLLENQPETRMIGRMYHFPCLNCGGAIGRSGHYDVDYGTMRCFQSTCEFSKWTSIRNYIWKVDEQGARSLDLRPPSSRTIREVHRPKDCVLPQGFTPIDRGDGMLAKQARKYLEGRNFDIDILAKDYGVGYVRESGNWYYTIIFPWRDELGNLAYYQGRDFSNLRFNKMRWRNPSQTEVPNDPSQLLYNQSQLLESGGLWVMEGVPDTITMGNAVGTGGKVLSPIQISLIKSAAASRVFVAFDDGVWLDTLNAGSSLVGAGKQVFGVCVVGQGEGENRKKDANGLGRDAMLGMEVVELTPENIQLERLQITYQKWGNYVATYRGKSGVESLW